MTNMDLFDIARVFFSLIAVVGMIGLCAIVARKFGLQNGAASMRQARRLAIVETLPLDQRRRAAIISCDGREHLVILDQSNVTIVESGIPAREAASDDPIANRSAAAPLKPLQVPAGVMRFMQRQPQDKTMAFRAAGVI